MISKRNHSEVDQRYQPDRAIKIFAKIFTGPKTPIFENKATDT